MANGLQKFRNRVEHYGYSHDKGYGFVVPTAGENLKESVAEGGKAKDTDECKDAQYEGCLRAGAGEAHAAFLLDAEHRGNCVFNDNAHTDTDGQPTEDKERPKAPRPSARLQRGATFRAARPELVGLKSAFPAYAKVFGVGSVAFSVKKIGLSRSSGIVVGQTIFNCGARVLGYGDTQHGVALRPNTAGARGLWRIVDPQFEIGAARRMAEEGGA